MSTIPVQRPEGPTVLQQPVNSRTPMAVRDGRLAVVTCVACGCRLEAETDDGTTWRHFGALDGRDAQGHRTVCTDLVHDETGRAAILA